MSSLSFIISEGGIVEFGQGVVMICNLELLDSLINEEFQRLAG
jgi:hypothetical protein